MHFFVLSCSNILFSSKLFSTNRYSQVLDVYLIFQTKRRLKDFNMYLNMKIMSSGLNQNSRNNPSVSSLVNKMNSDITNFNTNTGDVGF